MNKKINYTNLFFVTIIVIGIIVLFILSLKLIKDNEIEKKTTTTTTTIMTTKKTDNKGVVKNYTSPASIGETVLATFKDDYNVDITGIRFIDSEEASSYTNDPLKEGFIWEGLEYDVTFNDLDYLTEPIAPLLNIEIYNDTGSNFITFNGHNNYIKVLTIDGYNKIKNKETTRMKVIYQVPETKTHMVCFGDYYKKISCFMKS